MLYCYLLACLPVVALGILWAMNTKINAYEWLGGSVAGILTCLAFNGIAVSGMTSDVETRSGLVTSVTRNPEWVEKYKVDIYKNVTKTRKRNGKTETYTDRVFSHTETRYRTHPESYDCTTELGGRNLSQAQYREFLNQMGAEVRTAYHKSGFYSGDPDVYVCQNQNRAEIPVCGEYSFENRVQAAPSIFSYAKPPEDCKVLFDYPKVRDIWNSDRLLGTAASCFPRSQWEKMNGRLGPRKYVNVIAVGYPSGTDSMISQWQEAKWCGGKKNDIVITFAGEPGAKPEWVRVFGWTEKNETKREIENALIDFGTKPEAMPVIEKAIVENYVLKDWSKFDYITVEPPTWAFFVLTVVMLLTQGGLYFWFHHNEFEKKAALF